ncbi:MAG: glycosyltransferase [Actinobacteria bacterium]|nr:MAG: glycosyltransferase [Actinomycetota bacterium]
MPPRSPDLGDVLVVTVRKSFWASPEADRFRARVHVPVLFGHSTNLANAVVGFARALLVVLRRRPRVLFLGSVERMVPWFIRARRWGLLGRSRVIVTNQLHLDDEQLREVDRNVVYSQAWIETQSQHVRARAVFVPLPADGDFVAAAADAHDGDYVFAGGGTGRDFPTLIEALRGTDVPLRIVTFSGATLGWPGELPDNVHVEWAMPPASFLERIASARVVVVPLRDPRSDFGQTTVVQALSLGKPVVTTRSPGVVDYVRDGSEGFLVDAGDAAGYRAAVLRLCEDDELRRACGVRALKRARGSSYASFADRMEKLCRELLEEGDRG